MIFTFVVNKIYLTQYLGKPSCRSEAFNGILPKSQLIGTGCQIKLKMCQNIFYSRCFISQKACFFPFLMLEQHITSSFCQSHGWSILISHVFAWFMMGSSIYGKLPFEYLNDYQISLIVIARQQKYHRFHALVSPPTSPPSLKSKARFVATLSAKI